MLQLSFQNLEAFSKVYRLSELRALFGHWRLLCAGTHVKSAPICVRVVSVTYTRSETNFLQETLCLTQLKLKKKVAGNLASDFPKKLHKKIHKSVATVLCRYQTCVGHWHNTHTNRADLTSVLPGKVLATARYLKLGNPNILFNLRDASTIKKTWFHTVHGW